VAHSKDDLQRIATSKLEDAQILFEFQRYSNAYYLSGYAVECAFKACIANQIVASTIPERSFINRVFTHDYGDLVGLAGLRAELKTQQDKDPQFQANWALASEWSPNVRYDSTDKGTCNLMIIAVGDPDHGVLPWIKNFW